ncbi:MAG: SPOR domain-containing protein [Rhodobacteraceae bacterium]|nr:SPOR domain-containing protein [Paracoccaceae bacterium]
MAELDMGASAVVVDSDGLGGFSILFNWMGAALSVVLVAGLAVWGYQLAMRDVSGVPVIEALQGPMRIAPEDPGGEQAAHQGLAVNSVAADGGAEAPADRLILAPAPLNLAAEDLPRPRLDSTTSSPVPVARPSRGDMLALAEELAEGVTPLAATITTPTPGTGSAPIPTSVRGVSRSPLPRPRPLGDLAAEAVASSVALAAVVPAHEVDPSQVPVGTRLVQFGAFDSPDAARAEWIKLEGRFAEFLRDKKRIVQEAVSGGKTFYRLRAMGFADINDARRFCSALLADRQACIPVVVR